MAARRPWLRLLLPALLVALLGCPSLVHAVGACPGGNGVTSYSCSSETSSCAALCASVGGSCSTACAGYFGVYSSIAACQVVCFGSSSCNTGCAFAYQIDECCSNCNQCGPHANCVMGDSQQTCNCLDGYTGPQCLTAPTTAPTTAAPGTTAPPSTSTPPVTSAPPTTTVPTGTSGGSSTAPPTSGPPTSTAGPSTPAPTSGGTSPPGIVTAAPTGTQLGAEQAPGSDVGAIVGAVVGVIVGLALLLLLAFFLYRRRNSNRGKASSYGAESFYPTSPSSMGLIAGAPGKSAVEMVESTGNTTIVNTGGVMSLPGYLQLDYKTGLRMETKLGSGGGGTIYIGEMLDWNLRKKQNVEGKVVVKHISGNKQMSEAENQQNFEQEIIVMHTLAFHSNVVKLYGYCTDPRVIVLEYFPEKDLQHLISNADVALTFVNCLELAKDMAMALQATHSLGIIHRDVKPANFLIRTQPREPDSGIAEPRYGAYLTDFGVCRVKEGSSRLIGQKFLNVFGLSVRYAAPEVFARLKVQLLDVPFEDETKLDVYSYAITAWQLVTRSLPWEGLNSEEVQRRVTHGERPPLDKPQPGLEAALHDIIKSSWAQNASERPTFSDLVRKFGTLSTGAAMAAGRGSQVPARPPMPPPKSAAAAGNHATATGQSLAASFRSNNTTTGSLIPNSPSTTSTPLAGLAAGSPAATSSVVPHPRPAPPRPTLSSNSLVAGPPAVPTKPGSANNTATVPPPVTAPKPAVAIPKPPVPDKTFPVRPAAPPKPALAPGELPVKATRLVYRALYAYQAAKDDELSFEPGEMFLQVGTNPDGWIQFEPLQQPGAPPKWAPGNYFQLLNDE